MKELKLKYNHILTALITISVNVGKDLNHE